MSSLLKRILNRLDLAFLKFRIRKSDRMYVSLREAVAVASSDIVLQKKYTEYIREISTPEMTASMECLTMLAGMCRKQSYKKILDLGSGFSSFAFRMYAEEDPRVEVWSVDDDVEWIEKTRSFLERNDLRRGRLMLMEEFLRYDEGDFDLVFLDLNFVDIRKKYVRMAIERCKSGGAIIFDDVHKPDFMYDVLVRSRQLPVSFFDVKPFTLDRFGRFSILGVKH